MPTPDLELHHIAIASNDPDRLALFYENTLRLHKIRINPAETATRSVWFSLGSAILMIERCSETLSTAGGPIHHKTPGFHLVALRIAPAERAVWKERLTAAGAAVEDESPHSIYFRDPDGNRLALSHYPDSQP